MFSSSGPRAEEPRARRKVPHKRPEEALHRSVVRYLDVAYPGLIWSHFPAGERRDARTGAKLKAMGLKAGWPDFILIMPDARFAGLEIKAGKGKLSGPQQAFRDRARALGCLWAECRSLPEVEGTLAAWLTPFGFIPKARIAA